jgi:hypothetical protein
MCWFLLLDGFVAHGLLTQCEIILFGFFLFLLFISILLCWVAYCLLLASCSLFQCVSSLLNCLNSRVCTLCGCSESERNFFFFKFL